MLRTAFYTRWGGQVNFPYKSEMLQRPEGTYLYLIIIILFVLFVSVAGVIIRPQRKRKMLGVMSQNTGHN